MRLQSVTPANLTSEYKVKCFQVINPLVQDLAEKKTKIDKCDGTIRDLQALNNQLRVNLAVSEALAKEKERQIAHHQDLYTSHKNNSLVKDELLTALRAQIATQATTIKKNVKQIEEFQREAKETQEQIEQVKKQLEQKAKELQENELKIKQLENSLQEKNAQMQNVSAQLSIADTQLRDKQIEIDQLQTMKKEGADKLSQCEEIQVKLGKELATGKTERVANKEKIDDLEKSLQKMKNELDNLRKEKENALKQLSVYEKQQQIADTQQADSLLMIQRTQIEVDQLQSQLKLANTKLLDYQLANCLGYGNTSGIYQIHPAGIAPFDVLCDSSIAGPGWTVIQRRINGSVNFYRNWTEYRNGFGDLHGEFFIGLEKLFHMTSTQWYELYIHLETFSGRTLYSRYEEFRISGESDDYTLNIIRKQSGPAGNSFNWNENRKFTTYDVDNDHDSGNCAIKRKGGWWYDRCGLR